MADNAVERIKVLDKERAKLLTTAKQEALDRATAAVNDLNVLGFSYQLIEKQTEEHRKNLNQKRQRISREPCPICKFGTNPPHDARRHRFSQGKKKRPFTSKELSEMGMRRV